MKIFIYIVTGITMIVLLVSTRYVVPMRGMVTDAETGKPVEGAVALVEWYVTWGFGESYTETIKCAEKITDKNGRFVLPGAFHLLINAPTVVIYKKGYLAWRSDNRFPSYEKQEFHWKSNNKFQLERFDMEKCLEKYPPNRCSHNSHTYYFYGGLGGLYNDCFPEFLKASRWEELLESDEISLLKEKENSMKDKPKDRNNIWAEVLEELYGVKKGDTNE